MFRTLLGITFTKKACTGEQRLKKLFLQKPWWMWVFPVLTLSFLIAIPLFVWNATDAILKSTDGDFGDVVVDPSEAGYLTYVTATPSHLTFAVDDDGNLAMVAVIALGPNDAGGSLLLLKPETVLGQENTIASIYASEGPDETERSLKAYLNIGFTTSNTMFASNWDSYLAPVSPLSVDLKIPSYEIAVSEISAVDGSRCCQYEGDIELRSGGVGQFIADSSDDVSGELRRIRQQVFWTTWIEALAIEGDAPLIPGEVESGFGRMVSGLSQGDLVIVELPQGQNPEETHIGKAAARDAVLNMIPFPLPSSPGSRATVRLLDGVGGLDLAAVYSPSLVKAGAQILIMGNSSEFNGRTELIYHDEKNAELAELFKQALGGGEIFFEPLTDAAVEITVIIGDELKDRN